MSKVMSVLIHGTFSQNDPWTLPSEKGSLHNYLKQHVFPNDYFPKNDQEVFRWDAGPGKSFWEPAIEKLVSELKKSKFKEVRLIGHSHGATVANGAVADLAKCGIKVRTLINLAVPVRFKDTQRLRVRCSRLRECYDKKFKPDLSSVRNNRVFVLYANRDFIVRNVAHAQQNFGRTPINGRQIPRITRRSHWTPKHWVPTVPAIWRAEKWNKLPFE